MATLNDTESNKRVGFDTVRTIYSISAGMSFSLGIILNMLLAWLILTKTVNAMRMYSRLLLHSCLMASSLKIFYTLKSSGYSNRYCIYARSAYSDS